MNQLHNAVTKMPDGALAAVWVALQGQTAALRDVALTVRDELHKRELLIEVPDPNDPNNWTENLLVLNAQGRAQLREHIEAYVQHTGELAKD